MTTNRRRQSGAKQHYLPAAFLGLFSREKMGALRDRRIFVAQRAPQKVFQTPARAVAYVNNLYGPLDYGPLDAVWTEYERRLPETLNELSDPEKHSISGEAWLR